MSKQRFSRRQFLQMSGGFVAAAILTSCGGQATSPTTAPTEAATKASGATAAPTSEATTAVASKYKESPLLAAKVAAGELPPVDERLPENPLLVTPHESVGKYGGQWRQSVVLGTKGHAVASIGYYSGINLVVYKEDLTEIVPNIAESVEISEDAKTYTIKLRKGLRWNDGEPLTTEDVEFWWKDVSTNLELNPGQTENEGVTLNILDDSTYEIVYPEPRPLQLAAMAEYGGSRQFLPKHYLKQFHPTYTDADALTKAYTDAGFDDWTKYFADRNDYYTNPELPMMCPWVLTTQGAAATQLTFERNPYFFAVDTDGNQLPYMDSCIINIVESQDIVKMKAISGEFEVAVASIQEVFTDYPLYAENADAGDYKLFLCDFAEPNGMNIHLNQAIQDPVRRAIMEKADFRKAMALAINRPEIIATNWTVGPYASTPRNFGPYPASPYFDEELVSEYTDYDPSTANSMLDALGLDKKNADGMRLLPDGNVFSIVIDVPNYASQWIDIGTMLAENWKAVGINCSARSIDPSLWGQRMTANEWDASIFTGGGGFAVLSKTEIRCYTGYDGIGQWPVWFQSGNHIWRLSEGKEGIEPSAAIKRLWELGSAIVIEPDEDKQLTMIKEVLQLHKDNLWILGIGTRLPAIYLVKNYVKNVPPLNVDWAYGETGHGRPEQYFIDKTA
ncbi:MAG: ABC transporter substrate-binding protein [Chloroflexi bacterium]|nr:ABC transporter substrate-binding protein [Chloroflexota bacterium]